MLPQSNPSKYNEEYEKVVSDSVYKTLNQVLGSAAANVIYFYLEKDYSIKKDEIPEKLDSFCHAIQEYLNTGATPLEEQILKNLHSDLESIQEAVGYSTNFIDRFKTLIPQ